MMCINTIDLAQCGQPRGSADRSEARPRYAGARDCCHSEGRCGYAVPAESVSYTRTSGGLDRGGGGHVHQADDVAPVFFLSDSTGISAETMGNALLIQFPDCRFERTLIPFIHTVEDARRVVDLFGTHMARVEDVLGVRGARQAARLHGVGDIKRYNERMAAVEFTIEHDDGQSLRALEKSDVILLAPSRCGKTPTSMYLALQHGLYVANYPLVDEDLETDSLPEPVRPYLERCFGLTTTVERLTRVRNERRPGSRYSSPEQCRWELRRAADIFTAHRLPVIDTSAKSVEEISTHILQTLTATARARKEPS